MGIPVGIGERRHGIEPGGQSSDATGSAGSSSSFSLDASRKTAIVAATLALLLFLVLFGKPYNLQNLYLGDCSYGAYQGTLWNYWYVGEHLTEPSSLLRSDLQYYPFGTNVYLRIGNLLDIVLYQPFDHLLPDVAARNAFLWFVLWLDAMAMFLVAFRLSGRAGVSFALALAFTFNRFLFEELFYGRSTNLLVFPIPLFLLAGYQALLKGGVRRLVVAAGLLALAGLSYTFYGVFLVMAIAAMAPFHLWQLGARGFASRYLPRLAIVMGLTALFVLPAALPFLGGDVRDVLASYQLFDDPVVGIARGHDYASESWFWTVVFEHSLNFVDALRSLGVLSLIAVGFVAVAARRHRRALTYLAVAVMGFVLALGPFFMFSPETTLEMRGAHESVSLIRLPMMWLMGNVPYFVRFGHPERFIVVAQTGLLLALASATPIAMARLKGRWVEAIAAVAIVGLACADSFVVNRSEVFHSEPLNHSPFLRGLADDEGSVIVSLPLNASPFICDHQRIHRRPMLNGYGSFFLIEVVQRKEFMQLRQHNSVYRYLNQLMPAGPGQPLPDKRDWSFFIENNVRCAILHKSVFEPGRQYVRGRVVEYWNLKPDEYSVVEAGMLQLLGSPTFEDDDIAVFDLTRAWPDTPGAGSGDHSVQSMDLGTW